MNRASDADGIALERRCGRCFASRGRKRAANGRREVGLRPNVDEIDRAVLLSETGRILFECIASNSDECAALHVQSHFGAVVGCELFKQWAACPNCCIYVAQSPRLSILIYTLNTLQVFSTMISLAASLH